MQKITVNDKVFELTLWEVLTVKDLRTIYPLIKKYSDNEIEMVVEFLKALSNDAEVEEKVNALTVEEFTEVASKIASLIEQKKKTIDKE